MKKKYHRMITCNMKFITLKITNYLPGPLIPQIVTHTDVNFIMDLTLYMLLMRRLYAWSTQDFAHSSTVIQLNCNCNEWVSEWLLFNAKWAIFRLYHGHGENKLHSMKWWWCSLCSRSTCWVGFFFIAHWKNSPRVDMSLHSDTLSWFRAKQSLLLLLNVAWIAEKQQIPTV